MILMRNMLEVGTPSSVGLVEMIFFSVEEYLRQRGERENDLSFRALSDPRSSPKLRLRFQNL